jgi:4-hydroxybenzoate polyprenyltransferase
MNDWKIFDYIFLSRPILFFPGWATYLAGYAAAKGNVDLLSLFMDDIQVEWWNPIVVSGLLLFSCAMGGSFVLNQLQDIHTDKKNNKLFILGKGCISVRAGYIESFLLLGVALAGAFFLRVIFFFMILAFIIVTAYFYNFDPFAFKNRPIWGLAANMVMGWLAFALGWVMWQPVTLRLLSYSAPYLFFNTALYLLTTIPDMKGDRTSGKLTFPLKYGIKSTVILSLFFFILTPAAGFWHENEFMFIVFILTAPFMIRLACRQDSTSAIVAVKSGIASFALLICLKFPAFFLLLALIFFFTRFYYKRRFDFDYPNFKGQ